VTPNAAGAFVSGGVEVSFDGTEHPWWIGPTITVAGVPATYYLRYLDDEAWVVAPVPPVGLPGGFLEIGADQAWYKPGGAGDNLTGMLGEYVPAPDSVVTGNLTVAAES
jgi:hypothetical protein